MKNFKLAFVDVDDKMFTEFNLTIRQNKTLVITAEVSLQEQGIIYAGVVNNNLTIVEGKKGLEFYKANNGQQVVASTCGDLTFGCAIPKDLEHEISLHYFRFGTLPSIHVQTEPIKLGTSGEIYELPVTEKGFIKFDIL